MRGAHLLACRRQPLRRRSGRPSHARAIHHPAGSGPRQRLFL